MQAVLWYQNGSSPRCKVSTHVSLGKDAFEFCCFLYSFAKHRILSSMGFPTILAILKQVLNHVELMEYGLKEQAY